jgi:hypothetical protein
MQSKLERRELIWLLGGAATWPLAAHAQQAKQIRRVAVLSGLAETDPQGKLNIAAFRAALQERLDGLRIATSGSSFALMPRTQAAFGLQ